MIMSALTLSDTRKPESAMVSSAQTTGNQLALDARAGDAASLEAVMRRYNQRLFRLARSVTSSDSDAEDALQDAYVHAFRNLDSFQGRSSFSTWLSRIVLNEALGKARRHRREQEKMTEFSGGERRHDRIVVSFDHRSADTPETLAGRNEVRGLIEQAVNHLPDGFRSVFVLRVIEQLSVEETARILDIPEATVKTRTLRAKQKLKDQLEGMIEDAIGNSFPFLGERCDRTVSRVLARLAQKER